MTHPPTDPNTNPTPPVTEPPVDNQNPESNPAVIVPPTPTINIDEVRSLYNAALQEASQRAARAEAEAERLRNTQPAAPATTPEQDRQEFFDNPRKLIREEMNQIIRPLNEFQQRYTKQEIYNQFLQKAQNLPGYRFISNPLVQQGLANAANQMTNLTEEALTGSYNMIVGYLFSTGQLNETPAPAPAPTNPNPTPAPPTNNPPVQPPPNPKPSAPLPPVNNNQPKRRQLNEHEKQLARFNNMSEEDYLDFLEMGAAEVARSTEVKK